MKQRKRLLFQLTNTSSKASGFTHRVQSMGELRLIEKATISFSTSG